MSITKCIVYLLTNALFLDLDLYDIKFFVVILMYFDQEVIGLLGVGANIQSGDEVH